MGIKSRIHLSRKQLGAVLVVVLFTASMFAAYRAGSSSKQAALDNPRSQNSENITPVNPENSRGLVTPKSRFEEYKKIISENKKTGPERVTLYIEAAFAGANINAPESADYAKTALSLMPAGMKNDARNTSLVTNLQKIADGKYDEVSS